MNTKGLIAIDDASPDSDEEESDEEEEVSYRDTEDDIEVGPAVVMENPLHNKNSASPQRAASARYARETLPSIQGIERSSSARFASTASPQQSVEVEMMSTSSFASSASSATSPKRPKSARFADSTDGGVTSCDFTESNFSRNDIESGPSSETAAVKPPKRKKSFFAFAFADDKLSEQEDEDSSSSSSSNRGSESSRQEKRKSSSNTVNSSSSSTSPPTRKKSYFSFGSKRPTSEEITAEDDILKEMNAESMSWKNDLHQPGEWRKRVQEEERKRKEEKALQQKDNVLAPTINKLKKKKKKKSDDKLIDQFTVVFPLPSKDPLLSHRKIYDFSQAYGKVGLDEKEATIVERDTDLLSVTSEQATHMTKNTVASFAHQVTRDDLLKPMAVFAWPLPEQGSRKRSITGTMPIPSSKAYKVRGCASPELGAHVLLKFTNKLGYDLGTCVVCISHLINKDAGAFYSTEFVNLQLSSGGQKRGELSGKFSLKFLPSPISAVES
eukprot:gene28561-35442_t